MFVVARQVKSVSALRSAVGQISICCLDHLEAKLKLDFIDWNVII